MMPAPRLTTFPWRATRPPPPICRGRRAYRIDKREHRGKGRDCFQYTRIGGRQRMGRRRDLFEIEMPDPTDPKSGICLRLSICDRRTSYAQIDCDFVQSHHLSWSRLDQRLLDIADIARGPSGRPPNLRARECWIQIVISVSFTRTPPLMHFGASYKSAFDWSCPCDWRILRGLQGVRRTHEGARHVHHLSMSLIIHIIHQNKRVRARSPRTRPARRPV
jgi:hypothetical protein